LDEEVLNQYQKEKAELLAGITQRYLEPMLARREELDAKIKPLQDERNKLSRDISKMLRDAGMTASAASTGPDVEAIIKATLEAKPTVIYSQKKLVAAAIEGGHCEEFDNINVKFGTVLTRLRKDECPWLCAEQAVINGKTSRNFEYSLSD
jgi:hypothetical protein